MTASLQKVTGLLRKAGFKVGKPNRLGQHMHSDYAAYRSINGTILVNDFTPDKRVTAEVARIAATYDNVRMY